MKSIEIEEDVFDRLMRAKLPGESLSELLRRVPLVLPKGGTKSEILQALEQQDTIGFFLSEETLDELDRIQLEDAPPR